MDAEKAGANVTDLLAQLNDAEGILAQAENSYRTGDYNAAAAQAGNVLTITQEVTTAAQEAKQTALVSGQNTIWSTIALTVICAIVFVLALFLVSRRFKRRYIKNLSDAKPKVVSQMKLEGYKHIFVAVGLIVVLLIATPAIAGAIRPPAGERFSELYLLGPNRLAENYPSNIAVGQNYSVYVGVGNQLGSSAYYVLYVKFGNQTDQLPNANLGVPSSLQPLYEYRFSIPDGQNLVSPFVFSVSDASISSNQSIIKQLTINNVKFDVNKPATWDSNSTKFSYGLVFELWLYDASFNSIQYHNRFVDLQQNLTRIN